MKQISWYNFISGIYDYFVILPYRKIRLEAISKLEIKQGDTVLDLGCGTGLNLKQLSHSVGKNGLVIALEPSRGMLKQAQQKSKKLNLKNIIFVEKNISQFFLSTEFIKYKTPKLKVISILVISVIPDWKNDILTIIHNLPIGSNFLIMDLYSSKETFLTLLINKVAKSGIKRKSWIIMENNLSSFRLSWHKIPFYFNIKAFIAKGIKI